jgi:HEAT repeat protein
MTRRTRNSTVEPTLPVSVEEAIAHLSNGSETLLNAKLAELTSLNQTELNLLTGSWATIETKRRRLIVSRLVELAEDNLELNFDAIFRYCLKDPDDEVRTQGIGGLWENEEASLIDSLIGLLEKDSSEKVQIAAATALGKYAILAECNKLGSRHAARIPQALLSVINDEDSPLELRRRALEAVAPLSLAEVKQAIAEAYESQYRRLRVSSVYAMGKSLDPDWLPVLLKEFAADDAELRCEAAVACGELEEEAAVPGLVKLVHDSDIDVQMAAIQALGKIGTDQAIARLKQCLNSDNDVVRQTAQQVLNELEARQDPLSFRLQG